MSSFAGSSLVGMLGAALQTEPDEVQSAAVRFFAQRVDSETTVYALAGVFVLTLLLTFYVGVLYFRERRRQRLSLMVPKAAGQNALAESQERSVSMQEWQQRALMAEMLADNQAQMLREKLMPELTEFVKQSLVQGLAVQRDALLAMQQQALQHLGEMEARLANLQAPLQERIRAYESRIDELEREISSQNAEMRELTRAIMQVMRKKLEEEQEQVQVLEKFD